MQEKTLSFEQMPELIQNLVERIEALEIGRISIIVIAIRRMITTLMTMIFNRRAIL